MFSHTECVVSHVQGAGKGNRHMALMDGNGIDLATPSHIEFALSQKWNTNRINS
jgi:hypothetical protein